MELVKSSDHGELHEMNRKLQLMLEETLTKNMHLQQVGLLCEVCLCASVRLCVCVFCESLCSMCVLGGSVKLVCTSKCPL